MDILSCICGQTEKRKKEVDKKRPGRSLVVDESINKANNSSHRLTESLIISIENLLHEINPEIEAVDANDCNKDTFAQSYEMQGEFQDSANIN